MEILVVHREWFSPYNQTTILKDCNNKVKTIIPSSIKQPKKHQKSIIINCNTFLLNWECVAGKKLKIKHHGNIKQ